MGNAPEEIGTALTASVRAARETALATLANYGIAVGALVEELDFYGEPTGKVDRVTDIGNHRRLDDCLYLHGQKLRRDGSFGDYHHSIGRYTRVRIVAASAQ